MEMTLILLGGITLFWNGVMVGTVYKNCEYQGTTFSEEWDKEVNDSQDTYIGKTMMRSFYFIPQIISSFSRHTVTGKAYEE